MLTIKLKKKPWEQVIELERTKDILARSGQQKDEQILIGFAAETDHIEEYAQKKLRTKNADMIVANNVHQDGAGFGTDTNIVTFYKKDGASKSLPKLSKNEVAGKILEEVVMSFERITSMTVAKVIVDVPAKQTNRPFDYRIPDKFKEVIKQGCG